MKTSIKFILFFIVLTATLFPQDVIQKSIAIFPFSSNGVDTISLKTAENLLRLELSRYGTHNIISSKRTLEAIKEEDFANKESALETGKMLNAEQVCYCNLSVLGEKIIVQYVLVDIQLEKEVIIDQVTALSIEDLENVMKRIASGISTGRPISQNAEVGKIMESETVGNLKRGSNNNLGLSFGYLYPQYGYDGEKRTFVLDVRYGYEMDDFTLGTMIGVRHGIAINVFSSYLATKTDVCPFIGGSFGFHWVTHGTEYDKNYKALDKKGDGFEFALQTGFRLFRTYKFQILLNLEYVFTFNDFDDRAIVFTIGVL